MHEIQSLSLASVDLNIPPVAPRSIHSYVNPACAGVKLTRLKTQQSVLKFERTLKLRSREPNGLIYAP